MSERKKREKKSFFFFLLESGDGNLLLVSIQAHLLIYKTYPTPTHYLAHRRHGRVTMGLLRKFWNFSISLRINWYRWKEIGVAKNHCPKATATALKLRDLKPTALTPTSLTPTTLARTAVTPTDQSPAQHTPTRQALAHQTPTSPTALTPTSTSLTALTLPLYHNEECERNR